MNPVSNAMPHSSDSLWGNQRPLSDSLSSRGKTWVGGAVVLGVVVVLMGNVDRRVVGRVDLLVGLAVVVVV